jgi:hypothetical protein
MVHGIIAVFAISMRNISTLGLVGGESLPVFPAFWRNPARGNCWAGQA